MSGMSLAIFGNLTGMLPISISKTAMSLLIPYGKNNISDLMVSKKLWKVEAGNPHKSLDFFFSAYHK